MKIRQFFEHHGIAENPFSDEDAQTDLVFKGHCILSTHHPAWDKIYGNPREPSTAIVLGEKGAGKTALRLQIARHLADYNASHPDAQAFVIQYDDFNPFLDRFRERLSSRRRRPERALGMWRLWDHMDAILSLGVTQLVDRILESDRRTHQAGSAPQALAARSLNTPEARDLLLLAACYDQSTAAPPAQRWRSLRRRVRFSAWRSRWSLALGVLVTIAVLGVILGLGRWAWLETVWPYLLIAAGWVPHWARMARWWWRAWAIVRNARVLNHRTASLRRVLMRFPSSQIDDQPLPDHARTDDRYELLFKLQNVLKHLGFTGIVVLVDRVDEPYLINGSAELMRMLLWPMLDNKFLKHPGMGLKLLLPSELTPFIDRADRDFHERARLDKQNLVRSLEWTGQSLYDMANARLAACALPGKSPSLGDLFDGSVDQRRLIETMRMLRVPRHLFKFLYRVLVTHTNAHTDENPVWKISGETFESILALYRRDQEAFDRGIGVV